MQKHSAMLSTCIKLPFVFKTFVLPFLNGRLRRFYCITASMKMQLESLTHGHAHMLKEHSLASKMGDYYGRVGCIECTCKLGKYLASGP